jgi:23S rRNA (pseudouridine1915-N3)-methyltransferase
LKRALVLAIGKVKEVALGRACEEYGRRCSRLLQVEIKEVRDRRALVAALPKQAPLVVLDERGEQMTSRAFAARLQRLLESASREVVFVIGGPDGLDEDIRRKADLLLSLGQMTFAHRLVRLILCEQIYRAVSILEGSPYHRD